MAEAIAPYGTNVEVDWRSYLLYPEPTLLSTQELATQQEAWSDAAQLEPRLSIRPWTTSQPRPTHSFPAALAAKVANGFGPNLGAAFAERLFVAHFGEHQRISDRDVLVDVAQDAGIASGRFMMAWRASENVLGAEVWRDHHSAQQSGISEVQAVVVNRTWLLAGLRTVSAYREVIDLALGKNAQ